ncbi:hypothetical protein BGZ50_005772 [Haplosporangium sp. Z 11]|nr:hypothetical protein BGZ50_005772 [Haplosporangium sp. Z 11]
MSVFATMVMAQSTSTGQTPISNSPSNAEDPKAIAAANIGVIQAAKEIHGAFGASMTKPNDYPIVTVGDANTCRTNCIQAATAGDYPGIQACVKKCLEDVATAKRAEAKKPAKETKEQKEEDLEDKKENLEAKEEDPEAKEESPKAKEESPKVKEENPEAKEENPEAKEENPEVKEEDPEAKEEDLEDKEEDLEAKDS